MEKRAEKKKAAAAVGRARTSSGGDEDEFLFEQVSTLSTFFLKVCVKVFTCSGKMSVYREEGVGLISLQTMINLPTTNQFLLNKDF